VVPTHRISTFRQKNRTRAGERGANSIGERPPSRQSPAALGTANSSALWLHRSQRQLLVTFTLRLVQNGSLVNNEHSLGTLAGGSGGQRCAHIIAIDIDAPRPTERSLLALDLDLWLFGAGHSIRMADKHPPPLCNAAPIIGNACANPITRDKASEKTDCQN
jgi:hypothetical protein